MVKLESAMSTYRKILKRMMDKALPESRANILHNELRCMYSTMSYNFVPLKKIKLNLLLLTVNLLCSADFKL